MKVGFIRERALGDVLLTTGIIAEYQKRNPADQVYVQTLYPEVFQRTNVILAESRQILTKEVERVYDLDLCYERKPKVPIWQAYADFVFGFGQYDPNRIFPVLNSNGCDASQVKDKLIHKGIDPKKDLTIIHPLKSHLSRMLPQETWEEVINKLLNKRHIVLIVGSRGDLDMDYGYPNVYDFRGQFTIYELRELFKMAKIFIGCDSAPMHIAQTTCIPIVAIFSIANPAYRVWRPSKFSPIHSLKGCHFCLERMQAPITQIDCYKPDCLTSIKSEDILGW